MTLDELLVASDEEITLEAVQAVAEEHGCRYEELADVPFETAAPARKLLLVPCVLHLPDGKTFGTSYARHAEVQAHARAQVLRAVKEWGVARKLT